MANSYFEFKKFKIFHDKCGMKIGTDGVLLGAWADVEHDRRILDIGSGSGLIALMVAQRNEQAMISGIDIDPDAVEQANENASMTLWSNRLHFICQDVRQFKCEKNDTFDHLICNPPFYQDALSSPDKKRNFARNTSVLPFDELIQASTGLLRADGRFSVVLPAGIADEFIQLCWEYGLNLSRKTYVITKVGKSAKRVLLEFIKGRPDHYPAATYLTMKNELGESTEEYRRLTDIFYIR